MSDCRCQFQGALYNDLGVIRCSYCMGEVDKKTADEFREYNIENKDEQK